MTERKMKAPLDSKALFRGRRRHGAGHRMLIDYGTVLTRLSIGDSEENCAIVTLGYQIIDLARKVEEVAACFSINSIPTFRGSPVGSRALYREQQKPAGRHAGGLFLSRCCSLCGQGRAHVRGLN